jgi:hypothetical protein
MTHEQVLSLSAQLADYVVECTFEGYPYVTQPNGDVSYSDEAQDVFNVHYDYVEALVKQEINE